MQLAAPVHRTLSGLASYVMETLFPPLCAVCRTETGASETLCPDCWPDIAFLGQPACRTCGRPQPGADDAADLICDACLSSERAWDRGAAALYYAGAGRRLVLGLKHGDRLDTVPMLSGWMLRAGRTLVADADVIVPIPLHWTRRLKRRSNQAAELGRWIAQAGGKRKSFAPRALARHRRTSSQDGKNREARRANLKGALGQGAERSRLAGARVLLIDDVLTTGATLNEAASICRAAGAASVDILVLALVVRDETAYLGAISEDEDTHHEAG